MTGREPAWRICLAELLETTVEEPAVTERAASYLLTPVGARVNRCLATGSLSQPEPRTTPDASPFWRARLSDPTGAIDVTAGRFQPRALVEMQAIESEGPVMVVGKPHRFTTRDGRSMVALRAESLRSCTQHEVAELRRAAGHLEARIALHERILGGPTQPDEALAEGLPARWVAAQREAIRRYPSLDLRRYRELARLLREGSVQGRRSPNGEPSPEGPVRVSRREEVVLPAPAPPSPVDAAILVEAVDRLAEGSEDGYADLEAITQSAMARGLPKERIEGIVSRLQEEGILEEPLLGKLRRSA
jgi:uncharacterized protein